jgi:rRNA maturation protein Nop10
MPIYKCPKCNRYVDLSEGIYTCKVCGTRLQRLSPEEEEYFRFMDEWMSFLATLPPRTGDAERDMKERVVPALRKYRELMTKYPLARRFIQKTAGLVFG